MQRSRRTPRLWQIVREAITALGGSTEHETLQTWVHERHPKLSKDTIGAAVTSCTVNDQLRVHFRRNRRPRLADEPCDSLYEHADGMLIAYDPQRHGKWQIAQQTDGGLVVCVGSHYLASEYSKEPKGDEAGGSTPEECPAPRLPWFVRLIERMPEKPGMLVAGVLDGLGMLLLAPLVVLAALVCGGVSVPVALLATRIPPEWRVWIGYVVALWCATGTLVLTAYRVRVTWKSSARQELAGETVWASFCAFLVHFFWVTFVFAASYWMLDRLSPGRYFNSSGEGFVDWLYFSLMTVTTVGYGDITPSNWFSRGLTGLQVVEGLGLLGMFVGVLASLRAEELRHGHPEAYRNYIRMREEYRQTAALLGARSPEARGGLIEFARGICWDLTRDKEFGEGFLQWLTADPYARLSAYGVRQGGRILGFGVPGGPLVGIIGKFAEDAGWKEFHETGQYEANDDGCIQLYRLGGLSMYSWETSYEPMLADEVDADEMGFPPGYESIGSDSPGFRTASPVWVPGGFLFPESFARRILGYVDRYFVEAGHARGPTLAQSHEI